MKKFSSPNFKVAPLFFETYLALVKNSVGAKTFRNSFAKVGGAKKDILKNGGLSCAFFVSSILVLFKLIKEIHATVGGTERDMEKSGWIKIKGIAPFVPSSLGRRESGHTLARSSLDGMKKPKSGAVLVWEAVDFGRGEHKHIGFYVGKNKAISNHHKKGFPVVHHWTFGEKNGKEGRKVEAIYWNRKLS